MTDTKTANAAPSAFLAEIVGRPVEVKLTTGAVYRGVLACLDGFMNIAMEQCEQVDSEGVVLKKLGDAFLRGNNVYYIEKK